MSNYPPGVTGNEYAISGPSYEETEEKDCDSQQCLYVPMTLVRDSVATAVERLVIAMAIGGAGEQVALEMRKAMNNLNDLVMALPDVEVEHPCEWSGSVDVQGYGSQKWWTCPQCGIEHTEDLEDEGPDDERI